jgi:beta-lactamase superfamily II metal-dependent hydrolase
MLEWLKQNNKRVSFYALIIANILIWSLLFSLPLILTHPQADHLTGLVEVVKRYNIRSLWVSDSVGDSKLYKQWRLVLKDAGIKPVVVSVGDKMVFPDGTEITVLWPKEDLVSEDPNDLSLVATVSYGVFDALLTGDADVNNRFYTSSESEVEVLKVSHHGAKEAVDESFLTTISPEVSAISVGAKNPYGHPREEVVQLLKNFGSKVYRTDKNGTVEIVSDGKSWYTTVKR